MIYMPRGIVGLIWGVLILNAVRPSGSASAQREASTREAREQIAAAARADLRVWGLITPREGTTPTAESIDLERTRADSVMWRGKVTNVSHWHPYLIALHERKVIPLGGFVSAELGLLARSFPKRLRSESDAALRARWLASAADPNGASQLSYRSEHQDSLAPWKAWELHSGRGWPSDTVIKRPDGEFEVQLTLLSLKDWGGYANWWIPIAYNFLLTNEGSLVAWSQRIGEPIGTSGHTQ